MEGKDESNVEKALEGALGRKGRPGRNRESLEDSSHIGSLAGSKKPGRSVLGRWAKKCAESLYRAINNAADVANSNKLHHGELRMFQTPTLLDRGG